MAVDLSYMSNVSLSPSVIFTLQFTKRFPEIVLCFGNFIFMSEVLVLVPLINHYCLFVSFHIKVVHEEREYK